LGLLSVTSREGPLLQPDKFERAAEGKSAKEHAKKRKETTNSFRQSGRERGPRDESVIYWH
jgi:hypothetical protein